MSLYDNSFVVFYPDKTEYYSAFNCVNESYFLNRF
jgi:hypothetical protein